MTDDRSADARTTSSPPRRSRWRSFYGELVGQDVVDLVLRLTLVLQFVFPSGDQTVIVATTGLCICAMIYVPLRRQPLLWLVMGGFRLWYVLAYELGTANNSSYVIAYWYLAIACALWSRDVRKALALHARLLVGLMFLLATCWKLASPEYMNGSVFHFLLYADERFTGELYLMGVNPEEVHAEYATAVTQMRQLRPSISLERFPRVYTAAQVMTWWTIFIEGAIALLFLAPDWRSIYHWRNAAMLLFIVTTYPTTSLMVFAWTLSVLAIAHLPAEFRKTRFCYLTAFVAIFAVYFTDLVDLVAERLFV